MMCPNCGSRDNSRRTSTLDYLWVYSCRRCGRRWTKSKADAPGIREDKNTEEEIKGEIWDWLHSDENLTDFLARMDKEYGDTWHQYLTTIGFDPERRNTSARAKSSLEDPQ